MTLGVPKLSTKGSLAPGRR